MNNVLAQDMNFFRLRDFDFSNKRVLVRVDYNVPLDSKGRIVDTERIQLSLPTLNCILKQRPQQLVLITHWGRPQGKVVTSLKTDKLARTLEKSLKRKVAKLNNFQHSLPTTQIIMLENLRFWKGEEANSARFAQALANYGDIFVNEAFSTCHDAHASVVGIPQYLPSCAGLFLEKELHTITSTFSRPRRPFIAIIGGAKMNSKIKLLKNVLTKVDLLLLGGTMAFPFLVAQRKLASKYADAESIKVARWLLNNRTCARKLILAEDFVAMKDIGKKTIARFTKVLENAKTVAWNGPLGVVEDAHYRRGKQSIFSCWRRRYSSCTSPHETCSEDESRIHRRRCIARLVRRWNIARDYSIREKLPEV